MARPADTPRDPEAVSETKRPSYMRIHDILRVRIDAGTLPSGAVLLEGPIATLFGSSRSPVRQALGQLERSGHVRRFEGRGVMVGAATRPLRFEITRELLDLSAEDTTPPQPSQAEVLYYRVEREILTRSIFGRFRVNELALARHYDVGRTVARDLLLKGQQLGIVTKGEKAHWWIVPLDEKRTRDLYQLREVLEPLALRLAAPYIPRSMLDTARQRLREQLPRQNLLDISEMDELELDLHATCLGYCPNPEISASLARARASLIPGKHMQKILRGPDEGDSFIVEHLGVLDALAEDRAEAAATNLLEHLVISREKNVERLLEYRRRFQQPSISYIMA